MSKLKAGDLALVIGCERDDSNVGKVVELCAYLDTSESAFFAGSLWANDESGPAWIFAGEGLISMTESGPKRDTHSMADERHLMPLRGDFQPEQQKAKEVEA
ncbi:hypothetical protein [Pseudomonas aeruginosa]|uniref:hypothetical protein n=1 Tax=Pseudomonas aeruginosa TaxID=287 RepID=UPI001F4CA2F1|nr:hypothetical protein [Pseudomonas aeruginosa]UTQ24977.1 hypothetical protein MMZ72_20260 [Pseudomonas aeruginosa]